ncbi:pol [Symbiodinium sp. CCMP2592]|nr:pol [Symbiodinium sp. CCMP2592]
MELDTDDGEDVDLAQAKDDVVGAKRTLPGDEVTASAATGTKKPKSVPFPSTAQVIPNKGGGDCLFHAVAQAVGEVEGRKIGHRQVRAALADWVAANAETLKPHWDGLGPDSKDLQASGFTAYCDAIRMQGSWGGYLEIFATSVAHGLNVLVLCRDAVHKFPANAQDRGHYIVLKYDAAHYEYVRMESKDIANLWLSAVVPAFHGHRGAGLDFSAYEAGSSSGSARSGGRSAAGGRRTSGLNFAAYDAGSSCASTAGAGGRGLAFSRYAASSSKASCASGGKDRKRLCEGFSRHASHGSCAVRHSSVAGDGGSVCGDEIAEFPAEAGEGPMPRFPSKYFVRPGLYRACCDLCPYVKETTSAGLAAVYLHNHRKFQHGKAGCPGTRKANYGVARLRPGEVAAWRCPVQGCRYGITWTRMVTLGSRTTVCKHKLAHRLARHPDITRSKWWSLCASKAPGIGARARARSLNASAERHLRGEAFPSGFRLFTWPFIRRSKGKRKLGMNRVGQCPSCRRTFRAGESAEGHTCSPTKPAILRRRIKKLRALLAKPPAGHGLDKDAFNDLSAMTWLSTLNLGRGGVSKTSEALASFDAPPELIALQELGLNPESRVPYVQDWRRRGYSCVLGPGERWTRVGLTARCPISPFALPRQEANDRAQAFDLVQSVIGSLHEVGLPWILLGDFNLTLEYSGLQSLCARGACVTLDFAFAAPCSLPATRVAGNRRIDFGLSCGKFLPSELRHYLSVSDHFAVSYCFDFAPWRSLRSPSRVPLADCSEDEIAAKFVSCFVQHEFAELLEAGDVDGAWTLLSGAAERAMTKMPLAAAVPRSDLWVPVETPAVAKGARSDEPVRLRQLRRLHRRLLQLQRHPDDACLCATALRSLSALATVVPELCSWRDGSLTEIAACTVAAISRFDAELKADRLARWKTEVTLSQRKAIAWVKQRVAAEADGLPPRSRDPSLPFRALHPVSVIREAEEEWLPLWSREAPSTEAFEVLLREVGGAQSPSQGKVAWCGKALRRGAKAMCGRVAGHDCWGPEDLIRLPDAWFDALADLWRAVWSTGRIPATWQRARVSLLPKPDGGWRPLSITPVVWRLGSQHVVRYLSYLRPWCASWASPHILGGLAQRSVEQAHVRINEAMTDCAARLFVAQDLSKCFDCISLELALCALRHWGAPCELIALLKSFYSGQERLFSFAGHVGGKWHAVTNGILQGCPLSPLVAAALLQVWALLVCRDGVDGVIYIDDRTLWSDAIGAAADHAMRAALLRSSRFDAACLFACRPRKCQVASSRLELYADFVQDIGYPASGELNVLGLRHQSSGGCVPAKGDVVELALRCRFLRILGLPYGARAAILRCLVTSKFSWIASVATEISLALIGHLALRDCPRALVYEIFGWDCDPRFAFEWASLQAAVRWQLRLPVWHEQVCLRFALKQWPVLLPGSAKVLSSLAWWASADGAVIHRSDGAGRVRSFRIGVDSLSCLRGWLKHEFKRRALASLHRHDDPTLAQGILLPKPAAHLALSAKAHRRVFFEQGVSRSTRVVCLGSGCSVWFQNAFHKRPRQQWHTRCLCGLEMPSRPHLVFQCQAFASVRLAQGVTSPVNRAEERLLAVAVPELPPPPEAFLVSEARDEVSRLLEAAVQGGAALLLCATDGSAKESVAGWSVAVEATGTAVSLLETEDHLPFIAEVVALVVFFEALDAFRSLHRYGVDYTCSWVPAHGRASQGWRPPEGVEAARARRINAVADDAAKQCVLRAWHGSARRAWHRQVAAAQVRELQYLRAASEVAARYTQWVA